jgi:L-threonylcarbamoyladenylate synthase
MFILKLTSNNINKIAKVAAKFIKNGKVIICPTDTVYGLICDATDKKAVKRIFKIKNRSELKPVPIFVKDIKLAEKIAEINENQKIFLRKKWPGKMTVVLKRKGKKKIYGVDKKTIAIRIPKHKLINLLFKKSDNFLAETSVNISGQPPLNDIKKIIQQFEKGDFIKNSEGKPDLIIDAGKLKSKKSSIVVDLTGKKYKVLRKG